MCGCQTSQANASSEMSGEGAVFRVPDMSCGHCEGVVRAALSKALPGADVQIDLATSRVQVKGDADTAAAAIREAGYSPEAVAG